MGRYTGTWLQRQFYPEHERFTVHTPPDPGHGDLSDASHVTTNMDAPLSQPGGEIHSDALFENYNTLPAADPIDRTPTGSGGTKRVVDNGHFGSPTSPKASITETSNARGQDMGAPKRGTGDTIPLLGHGWLDHEQPFTVISEGMRTTPMANQGSGYEVLRRGLNADPINDGDSGRDDAWTVDAPSWKLGRYIATNIQRRFQFPSLSRGEVKYAQERTVTIIGDAPPPEKSTKYDSPYSTLQRFMPKRVPLTGGIRRQPGPWDEPVIVANAGLQTPATYGNHTVVP